MLRRNLFSFPKLCRGARGLLVIAVLLLPVILTTPRAQALQTGARFLFDFNALAGVKPRAGLIRDGAGNFYGTTVQGGPSGNGLVFKLDPTGTETVLYNFSGTDGGLPYGGLIRDQAGNLYGTTFEGGAFGRGVVFKLDQSGVETVLHSFAGGDTDGAQPYASLIGDAAGNLYGTTSQGGPANFGVLFKLDAAGNEIVLHIFSGPDGAIPVSSLSLDLAGNLYGTTASGVGNGMGVVFKLDPAGTYTVLYRFSGGADGSFPQSNLLRDAAGNLYGTAISGGKFGWGVAYKVDSTGKETVLYNFKSTDGRQPYAGLVRDAAGNFYGTTYQGGAFGFGTVFKLGPDGAETVLYSFDGDRHGAYTYAPVIPDGAGHLYGVTYEGGNFDNGTVFAVKQ